MVESFTTDVHATATKHGIKKWPHIFANFFLFLVAKDTVLRTAKKFIGKMKIALLRKRKLKPNSFVN